MPKFVPLKSTNMLESVAPFISTWNKTQYRTSMAGSAENNSKIDAEILGKLNFHHYFRKILGIFFVW
jgi:hypothetical protein